MRGRRPFQPPRRARPALQQQPGGVQLLGREGHVERGAALLVPLLDVDGERPETVAIGIIVVVVVDAHVVAAATAVATAVLAFGLLGFGLFGGFLGYGWLLAGCCLFASCGLKNDDWVVTFVVCDAVQTAQVLKVSFQVYLMPVPKSFPTRRRVLPLPPRGMGN